MSVDTKTILLALLNALLITAGTGFQKLNAIRGGNAVYSWLLLASFLSFAPTFFTANIAYALGGRVSLLVAVTAINFVLIAFMGRLWFDEPISPQMALGITLIVVGVSLVALGQGSPPSPAPAPPPPPGG